MLGIEKYDLNYISDFEELNKLYKKQFTDLLGKSIESYFVQWELNENTWNEDGPIILLINGVSFEFTAYQFDYSFTINKIKRTDKLDWYGAGSDMPLEWHENPFERINTILNRPITKIYALEYGHSESFNLVGFEFEFEGTKDCLHISNGLDCNTIKLYRTINNDKNKRIEIKND